MVAAKEELEQLVERVRYVLERGQREEINAMRTIINDAYSIVLSRVNRSAQSAKKKTGDDRPQ